MKTKAAMIVAGLIAFVFCSEVARAAPDPATGHEYSLADPRLADRGDTAKSARLFSFVEYARERDRAVREEHLLGGLRGDDPIPNDNTGEPHAVPIRMRTPDWQEKAKVVVLP